MGVGVGWARPPVLARRSTPPPHHPLSPSTHPPPPTTDGMIVGLERDLTSVVILGNERLVKVGDRILARKGIIAVQVGVGLLGRVLSPLGVPIDDKNRPIDLDMPPVDPGHRMYFSGDVQLGYRRPVETDAPGIVDRKSVSKPLLTGITCIDAMVPIGALWGRRACGGEGAALVSHARGRTTPTLPPAPHPPTRRPRPARADHW